ncbi:AraC family transcriptional regulator [Sphingobacterium sp. SRCM116780]|uniref:AraC family transcriptional regulator n=1 Tax=Sphingobacterium sp. SRCM116780 TaxID=2907623 RepID=UPI001F20A337|nr:helix-turn-helix transcriptional regulator [Sphingobacterium sp. SRCM116780]UIR57925.1 AraC family transcriptional regulator [Sphingobacterium sp. SRCM116780]
MTNKNTIPVLDNCSINNDSNSLLLVEHLEHYIQVHHNMVFPHKHNFYHFVLFTQGSGSHLIDFEKYEIEDYQIYFMAPGQVHTWNFKGDEAGYVVNFNQEYFQSFLLRTDYLNRFSFLSGQNDQLVFTIPEAHREQAIKIFETLYETSKDLSATDLIRVSLLQLLLWIESWHGTKLEKSNNPYNYTIFHNYQQLVEKNFKENRLPKTYAEQLFITPNHLNAICKSYIGSSAGEIIRERILLEAKRLLINKSLNINEIAVELNFNDNSYFTKFFKKATGLTPDEFRKNNS